MPHVIAAMMQGIAIRNPRMSSHTASGVSVSLSPLCRCRMSMASRIWSTWMAV